MIKFVTAINTINSQVFAFLTVILGCVMVVICHHFGINDTSISAGIVGAGINMLTHDIIKAVKGGDTVNATFQNSTESKDKQNGV